MSAVSFESDWNFAGFLKFYVNDTTQYVDRWAAIKMSKLWILKEKPKTNKDYADHKLDWDINYDNIENIIDLKTFTSIKSNKETHSFDLISNINSCVDDTADIHMQYSFQVENEQQKIEWIANIQKCIECIETITHPLQPLCMGNCGEFGDPNYSNYCAECYKKPDVINSVVIDGYIRLIIQTLMPNKIIPKSLNRVCLQFYNSIPCLGGCSRFEYGSAKTSNYCTNCFALLFKNVDWQDWLYHEIESDKWVKRWGVLTHAKICLFKEEKEYTDPTIMVDLNEKQTVKSAFDVRRMYSFVVGDDIHLATDSDTEKETWIRYVGKAIVLSCINEDFRHDIEYEFESDMEDSDDGITDFGLNVNKETNNVEGIRLHIVHKELVKPVGIFDDSDDDMVFTNKIKEQKDKTNINGIFDDSDDDLFGTKQTNQNNQTFV